jgi:DNA-binding CsgD family transcriptional regulator
LPLRRPITERERDVLDRVCRGQSNKTIATEMGMSEQGAKAHVSKLFLKFGVSNRAGLATARAEQSAGAGRERAAGKARVREGELRDVNRTLTRTNTALGRENDRLRGENATLRGRGRR